MALIDIVEHTCCNCGLLFWVTKGFDSLKLSDKMLFFCPAGHSQSYDGITNIELLRRERRKNDGLVIELYRKKVEINCLIKKNKKLEKDKCLKNSLSGKVKKGKK